ncbi:hypothetical protein B4U80_06222 [Leptotrombidium deliense]|uniref:Uncharacterized protein n=1 Tax=Leptotrombidium deliense TaxID=299467 RepID=A0A443SAD4_9ACAR|nr:hypothetical protein B4U80_06222 [Leptotrombidium deliense]
MWSGFVTGFLPTAKMWSLSQKKPSVRRRAIW